jgi:hypothetical protein
MARSQVKRGQHAELIAQLDHWIAEGGEIAKVARRVRARLIDCTEDTEVLAMEVGNMRRYFKR